MSQEATSQFNIPVCLFVFKRLEPVKMIFDVIKQVKPLKMYVFADGPRIQVDGEAEKVSEVREYVSKVVDWDCEKSFYFFDENKGCDRNIVEGLNIFFSKEEKGIIFEDDAVPEKEFFPYCEYLLNKYQRDSMIQYIAGFNAIGDNNIIREDYSFGKTVPLSGAFATWSDRWNNCDFTLKKWPEYKKSNSLKSLLYTSELRKEYTNVLDELFNGKVAYWDYKFDFDMFIKDRLAIVPRANMATSYGFMEGAFHIQDNSVAKKLFPLMTKGKNLPVIPLKEPDTVERNNEYDRLRQKKMLEVKGSYLKRQIKRVKQSVKDLLYKVIPGTVWNKTKSLIK